jgi:moderate conductance mechanosensitive channel
MAKLWNKINMALDYDALLMNLLKVLTIIIGAMIIYVMVRIIIKRIFSISIKTRSIRLKDSIYIRKRQQTLEKLILSLWRYFIYIMTFLMILSLFGMNIQTILAGAGILGVIFAVGSQRLLQDFVDGFFNIFEDNISVGDYVEIDKVEGTIVDIGLRTIKIKSWTGEIHIVPNSKIGHMINYSLDNGKAIVDIKVDYTADVDRVYEILKGQFETIKKNNPNILTPLTILGVNKLDTIGYDVRITCETIKETHWSVQRYIRAELIKLFTQHRIDIGMNQIIIKDNQNQITT